MSWRRAQEWGAISVLGLACPGCEQFALVGTLARDAGSVIPEPSKDAGLDATTEDATTGDGGAATCGRQVDVCDPVTNTGCAQELAMRCAPDLSADRLAGYCTFVGPIGDGGIACLNTVVTESCPVSTTCFEGECRRLCFCDADCGEGSCCTEPLGDQGFSLCTPC